MKINSVESWKKAFFSPTTWISAVIFYYLSFEIYHLATPVPSDAIKNSPLIILGLLIWFIVVVFSIHWLKNNANKIVRTKHVDPGITSLLLGGIFGGLLLAAYLLILPDTQIFPTLFFATGSFSFPCTIFLIVFLIFGQEHAYEKPNKKKWLFAPGSSVTDQFGRSEAAKKFAEKIITGKTIETIPVSVIGLFGQLGEGKSTFVKLALNSGAIDPDETLYTYISLTETNHADDFSSLFAKKWKSTLNERYVIADPVPVTTRLAELVGATSDSLSSVIRNFALLFDPMNNDLWFHVVQPVEKRWIIVVDEIERAPLNEVLRVIETIERVRLAAESNELKIPVVFILCVSPALIQERTEPKSDELIKRQQEGSPFSTLTDTSTHHIYPGEVASIVSGFLFEHKLIDVIERLPAVPTEIRVRAIMSEFSRLLGIQPSVYLPVRDIDMAIDADNDQILSTIIEKLAHKQPRVTSLFIKRVLFNIELFKTVSPTELVVIEYIKMEHALMFEEMKKKFESISQWKPGSGPYELIEKHYRNNYSKREEIRMLTLFIYAPAVSNKFKTVHVQPNSLQKPENLRSYFADVWDA